MPGVRLHHPDLRGCTYTLVHFGRALVKPHICHACNQTHLHKTYHLALDQVGDVVVSELIYDRLKEAGLDELTATKEIHKPETQHIDFTKQEPLRVVSRESAPVGG